MGRDENGARRALPRREDLERAAIDYLKRFAASEADLRRVLQNRLRTALFRQDDQTVDAEGLKGVIETIIDKHRAAGVLNDGAFADMKVASLRRSGRSARAIAAKLQQKGIKADLIKASFQAHDEGSDPDQAELKAARHFAKQKRLGPFSVKEQTKENGRKELARLARAGFALAIAYQVLQMKRDDEDEESFDLD